VNIDDLQSHGITIMVLCKEYSGGQQNTWKNGVQEHIWTSSCQPYDVVEVTQRITGLDLNRNE
jgi:hypothetical protein